MVSVRRVGAGLMVFGLLGGAAGALAGVSNLAALLALGLGAVLLLLAEKEGWS